jgi:endonuclease/exonuclease/phosphatase family metal-dependent hydrolase
MKLASWNLRNLSKKRSQNCVRRLAEIFIQYQILALQEVRDEIIIQRICEITKQKYIISHPVGNKRKELYAFIYHTDVALISYDLLDAAETFIRPPFMGFFKYREFDFVLVSIHVIWGKRAQRISETQKLDDLLQVVLKRCDREKDVILCGDFNIRPHEFPHMGDWRDLTQLQPEITGGSTTNVSGAITKNMYDNIWVNSHSKFTCGGIQKIENITELSDHFPVWAQFECDVDLDDQVYVNLGDLKLR